MKTTISSVRRAFVNVSQLLRNYKVVHGALLGGWFCDRICEKREREKERASVDNPEESKFVRYINCAVYIYI